MARSIGLKSLLLAGCTVVALYTGEANATTVYDCNGDGIAELVTSCTLGQLVRESGAILVDDKLFDNWSFPTDGVFSFAEGSGSPANADLVIVTGLEGVNPGLRFEEAEDTWNVLVTEGFATQVSTFAYDVTALDQNLFIHDNELTLHNFLHLGLNLDGGTSNGALTEVREVHAAIQGDPKRVFGALDGSGNIIDLDFDDARDFAPTKTLTVTTVINSQASIFGGGDEAFARAGVVRFEERFSQIQQVPGPPVLGLLGLGLGVLSLLRCRARKSGRAL